MKQQTGSVLMIVGAVVAGVGAVIAIGNMTGLFPTIPYAGGFLASVGFVVEAVGISLREGKKVIELEERRTSPVLVLLSMLLFVPLFMVAVMMFFGNLSGGASAGRWIGTSIFMLISGGVVFALIRERVRG